MGTEYNTILGSLNSHTIAITNDADYTILSTDQTTLVFGILSTTRYIYFPSLSAIAAGRRYKIINQAGATQSLILLANGSDNILSDGASASTYTLNGNNYCWIEIFSYGDNTNWIVMEI